jgi:molybdenum cofactor cytidylyltransferase
VEWRDGLGSSIRRGLQDVSTSAADSVILLASDQPLLGADFLKRMIATRLTSGKPIVASAYGGTVGIPALFDRSAFPDLLKLEGDRGAKQLILSRRSDVAEIPFPGGEVDIDTPADYERLTSVSSRGSADAEGPPSRSDDNVPRNT